MAAYAYSWDDYTWSYPEFHQSPRAAINKALEQARLERDGRQVVYIGRCISCKPGIEDFSIEGLMEDISCNFSARARLEDIDIGASLGKRQWKELARKVWETIEEYLTNHNELDEYFSIEESVPYDLDRGAPLTEVEKIKFEAADGTHN